MRLIRPAVALAFVVVLAGCLGGTTTISASPATIPSSAYESHGYVHGNSTVVPLSYDVGVGPASRTVGVEMWVSGYSKTTADDDIAGPRPAGRRTSSVDITGLLVVSSPNRQVAGQSVNPLANLGNRELVGTGLELLSDAQALGNVPEINGLREVSARNVTLLGEETELVTYEGTIVVEPGETTLDVRKSDALSSQPESESDSGDGESVAYEGGKADVRLHVATVEHEGDVVVVLAIHGAGVDETDAVAALASAVEHPGTVEKTGT